ncbi:LOW QUALITY PROTEIN: ABSCISIC ACID-INSENSITIVE 5-like protein 2 [Durio zibethinus]|uniref:LOW QUALITY PROTEIN: ABSCISIC ACID-INSENSITIVE 5-like protein 2 n=1 Tax=Durio zibethinus TaxID=66656 RepID=A0A6P5YYE6_DURZI|nr:LOW QUALITY PROTEIN: ABSCISIC ACID-INSENSITIVE 5-like protein 2 [Durio zibethinus]
MGIQTMGSQGDSGSNGKQSQFQHLTWQNSMYSLTLDEVQNQLGDLGKPLSSMNLDELLKNVWTVEANQTFGMETEGTALTNQTTLQRQASFSLTSSLSKKTVDEVWRDIQQSKNDGEKKSRERQPTLGEMTLEDFLVKAGVVVEASTDKGGASVAGVDLSVAPQFAQQGQWMQYPQYQHPQQGIMGVYMPAQPMPQPLAIGATAVMDVSYPENQVPLPSPLMGTLSDTQASGRKRGAPEDMVEKNVERRQKRMIKNRESAARSRARKQAYTNELENKVSRLEEENERLRKRKELEKMLPSAPPPEPKYQLRRTSSAPF